jgi:hypothetical protein
MGLLFRLRVSFCLRCMAESSNVSAPSFALRYVNARLKPSTFFEGLRKTFFEPDSGSWMPFLSSVSWRWRTFRATENWQSDRKLWTSWEPRHEAYRRRNHELAGAVGTSYGVRQEIIAARCRQVCPPTLDTSSQAAACRLYLELRKKAIEDRSFICRIGLFSKLKIQLKIRHFENVSHSKGIINGPRQQ